MERKTSNKLNQCICSDTKGSSNNLYQVNWCNNLEEIRKVERATLWRAVAGSESALWFRRFYAFGMSESSERRPLRVVHLGLVFRVRRRQFSVDGGREAAAVLVVVGQRQVQQAGAGGQVDVLHVVHLRATHRAELTGARETRLASRRQKRLPMDGDVYIPGFGKQGGSIFLLWWNLSMKRTKTRREQHMTGLFLFWSGPSHFHGSRVGRVNMLCAVIPSQTVIRISIFVGTLCWHSLPRPN